MNEKNHSILVFPDGQMEFDSKEAAERRFEALCKAVKHPIDEKKKKMYKPIFSSSFVPDKSGARLDELTDFMRS